MLMPSFAFSGNPPNAWMYQQRHACLPAQMLWADFICTGVSASDIYSLRTGILHAAFQPIEPQTRIDMCVCGSHKPLDWLTASLMCCLTWCTIGYPLQTLETCVISFTSETRSPWQSSHLQNKANYINPAISIQVCPQMIRLCLWTLKYKQSTQHIDFARPLNVIFMR